MIAVEIAPVALPASAEGPGARDFIDYVELANAVMREQAGGGALHRTPGVVLGGMRDTSEATWTPLLARIGGRAAGAAQLRLPHGSLRADLGVFVPRRDAGLLEALLIQASEDQARASGRIVLRAVSLHRPDPGAESIPAADERGAVPRDPQARALFECGYSLEQVAEHRRADPELGFESVHLSGEWRKRLAG